MNTSDLISTSIQRKIAIGTQPIKLSTSIYFVCRLSLGCMMSPPICDVATTLSQRCVPTGMRTQHHMRTSATHQWFCSHGPPASPMLETAQTPETDDAEM